MKLYAKRMELIDTENAFKIGPHIAKIEAQGHRVIKCNLGEPDFSLPDYIKEEVKRQIDNDNTHYTDPKGILPFRKAIANQIKETRGIEVSPEQIVVFPGAKPPIGFSQQVYIDEGDEVIYPSPGFPIYESFIRYFGGVPVPLHLKEENDFSFTPQELEALITPRTKLIILNFPSNPTGGVATYEQLKGISEVINSKCDENVRVYSDEVYEYIVFDGKKHISIAAMPGMQDKTIIVSGHSKTFAWTGGRVGYAVFPTVEEAEVFKNLNINYFSCVPPFIQEAARVALENKKERDKSIKKMVDAFQERRDVVVSMLNSIDGVTCVNPSGAFYVFPNIKKALENLGAIELYTSLPEEERKKTTPSTMFQMFLLYNYHVATMDRRSFGRIGIEGQEFLRISIATDKESLIEAVKRIEAALKDVEGFKKFVEKGENLY